ncbi:proton-activated chloride channel [Denticeps clupeoides]|uniref:Proton-activated chloride channel n=1 Tax=Denticeps clupeoides TaxID=299321 RepID=A0AAY4C4Q5_9TELE|nr:transmembrane protein 206 [Denticeps clupeoides]
MLRREITRPYQEIDEDGTHSPPPYPDKTDYSHEATGAAFPEEDPTEGGLSLTFNKACLKSVFSVVLIFIYLSLTAVAAFLAYQTITDFMEKVNHPVMSVRYKEVDQYDAPGIALFPGKAKLLSCQHYYHDIPDVPTRISPGELGGLEDSDCIMKEVVYSGPYSNFTTKQALVVQGPTDVRNQELIFLQFSQNDTEEDFSAISYMIFGKYSDMSMSSDKETFMRDCERNYSLWTFSGGFRTWVKMSLVKTSGRRNESTEFRQESSVVKYNDRRPVEERTDELFFIVFQWRDPFIQEVQDIVTANPWNTFAILCGVFMALFKAANFAKLSIRWMIKIRRSHRKDRSKELNQIT